MSSLAVVGLQWGDEGKGKVVDALTAQADVVCRYGGGANAGHTVYVGEDRFVLHLVPSGILHPDKSCVIGNGAVVDPDELLGELEALSARGIASDSARLLLSERAHIVMPYHMALDRAREESAGSASIGTTGRGIGPCYTDKAARRGVRLCDLASRQRFDSRLQVVTDSYKALLGSSYAEYFDLQALRACFDRWQPLIPFIGDGVGFLHDALERGERVLFEGAQGALLDVDFGTYPFVTSSNAGIGGVCSGSGVPPQRIGSVLGVAKAYTTRVGNGPFPTELGDELGQWLRDQGQEFGATTGRPRRCGWFDVVATRHAVRFCGIDAVCLTKLDVLSGLDELKVAVAYDIDGERTSRWPAHADALERAQPIYESVPGWQEPLGDVREESELPAAARDYVAFLEHHLGVPVAWLSVGKRRDQLVRCGQRDLWVARGGSR